MNLKSLARKERNFMRNFKIDKHKGKEKFFGGRLRIEKVVFDENV